MEQKDKKEKSVKKDAFETAVKFLAVSPRSEKEVREKLYSKGFHKQEVEEAIARAKSYRYIDDEAYVNDFVDYCGARYGRKKIEYKLVYEKGIAQNTVTCCLENKLTDESELEKAVGMAEKYIRAKRVTEKKDFRKVAAFLYQKGFDGSTINAAMNKVADIPEFDD